MSVVHVIYQNKHFAVPEEWEHPGGDEDILDNRGKDITDDFDSIGHSRDAHNTLASFSTVPVTYKGTEYRISVQWLATDEATRPTIMTADGSAIDYTKCNTEKSGDTSIFGRFIRALGKGEAATTALMDEWPAEVLAYATANFAVPAVVKKPSTDSPPSVAVAAAVPLPAAAAVAAAPKVEEAKKPAAAAAAPPAAAARKECDQCPMANPKVWAAIAAIAVIAFCVKSVVGKKQ